MSPFSSSAWNSWREAKVGQAELWIWKVHWGWRVGGEEKRGLVDFFYLKFYSTTLWQDKEKQEEKESCIQPWKNTANGVTVQIKIRGYWGSIIKKKKYYQIPLNSTRYSIFYYRCMSRLFHFLKLHMLSASFQNHRPVNAERYILPSLFTEVISPSL